MASTQSMRRAQKPDASEIASVGLQAAPFQYTNGNPSVRIHAETQQYITEYWTEASITKLIENQKKDMFVTCDQSGKITGFTLLSRHDPCPTLTGQNQLSREQWACLDMLFVHPDFHKQSIRSSLLKEVEELAKSNGMELMWLTILEVNEIACKFYHKHGYAEVDRSDFPDMPGVKNEVTMVKNLKDVPSPSA